VSASVASSPAAAEAHVFVLPPELEAHEPPEARGLTRDGVRLLVSARRAGAIEHAAFVDLPRYLRPGDVLVLNDSRTLPAAVTATRPDGSALPLHLSVHLPGDLWTVEPRGAVDGIAALALPAGGVARLLAPYRDSRRLWIAALSLPEPVHDYLHRAGRPIAYSYVRGAWPIEMYQTVYAGDPGSAEMPSAGRPFTVDLLRAIAGIGVRIVTLTLHAGVASLEGHEPPYEERFEVPAETAQAVAEARDRGGRVIAVGTTSVRALESAVDGRGRIVATRGWTDLVITRARGVSVVDGLLTGFHEPKATHLEMLSAIAGEDHLRRAYHAALAERYLWHEFGDLHLLV
jgi:S-adenosylmethionine:tRNA ribosyltransferase-isomerase